MSTFSFLLLCVQACLVQNVYSQCIGAGLVETGYGFNGLRYGAGMGLGPALAPEFVAPGFGPYAAGIAPVEVLAPVGAYGGAGIGDIAVAGEMPVAGTTLVAGQVPILGAVRFAGDLPAAGTVSIAGSCGCGGGAYLY